MVIQICYTTLELSWHNITVNKMQGQDETHHHQGATWIFSNKNVPNIDKTVMCVNKLICKT